MGIRRNPNARFWRAMARAEKKLIREALKRHDGSIDMAAYWLGIERTTLYEKARNHGIIATKRRSEAA